ncbi:unnamed protein product [Gordionus sp. m RMFG-2023]
MMILFLNFNHNLIVKSASNELDKEVLYPFYDKDYWNLIRYGLDNADSSNNLDENGDALDKSNSKRAIYWKRFKSRSINKCKQYGQPCDERKSIYKCCEGFICRCHFFGSGCRCHMGSIFRYLG